MLALYYIAFNLDINILKWEVNKMTNTLELSNFSNLSEKELDMVDGGGFVAFVYALGFIAGTSPLAVCVGGGLVLIGAGMCIYDACTD